MRVLQINSVVSYGSTGMIVRDIYDELVSNGHECLILFGRGKESSGYNCKRIETMSGLIMHGAGSMLLDAHGLFSSSATKKLIAVIESYQPDLIQLHNVHGYYLHYPMLFRYLKECKIPVVWLMHDQWALSGGTAYIDNLQQTRRKSEERKQYPKTIFIEKYQRNLELKRQVFSSLSNLVIVTPSNWLAQQFKESYLGHCRIETIHNGIDLERFWSDEEEPPSTTKKLLGVASVWDERKGADYFLRLAEDLDSSYHITLVGVDKKLKAKIQQQNLPINCIGRVSSIAELARLYRESDIFVNPTLQDNFPTVNLEAQACGTPVITFNTGGSGESVEDGITGRIISVRDYDEFLKAIIDWPLKTESIVQACQQNAGRFSKQVQYKEYTKLYQEVIGDIDGFK
ncbi:TPA: glycosyltransferase [Streptococcus suis]|nr:glycosyltransferase [Streptococcus suis]